LSLTILLGDAREKLREIESASVQCCVTSPPYWGLRDYGVAGQIGQEPTPEAYAANLCAVFSEVWRVLRADGTLWLNLGDSYAAQRGGTNMPAETLSGGKHGLGDSNAYRGRRSTKELGGRQDEANPSIRTFAVAHRNANAFGLKHKDLIGIPWRVAFALQAAGWTLRSDIIWAKRNCMPESVTDRPTRSHEYVFLLSKSARYYYDADAIKEPCIYDVDGTGTAARKSRAEGNKLLPTAERNGIRAAGYKNSVNFASKNAGNEKQRGHSRRHDGFNDRWDSMEKAEQCTGMRNKRDVWTVAPANYPDAHFATYPPDLIKPCILAGCPAGGVVLDPFAGSGTTGEVALELGRRAILCELNPAYMPLIQKRTSITVGFSL